MKTITPEDMHQAARAIEEMARALHQELDELRAAFERQEAELAAIESAKEREERQRKHWQVLQQGKARERGTKYMWSPMYGKKRL